MSSRRSNGSRRRSSRRRKATTTVTISGRVVREVAALVLLVAAIISTIALFAPDAGMIVKPWHDGVSYLLGWGIAFAPILLAGFAFMLWLLVPGGATPAPKGVSRPALTLPV